MTSADQISIGIGPGNLSSARARRVCRRAVARQWRDLPVAGREVSLGYVPREIMCPTHGRTEEDIPWAARHARVSYRFEYAMMQGP